jgi:hypothetical protein
MRHKAALIIGKGFRTAHLRQVPLLLYSTNTEITHIYSNAWKF